MSVRAESISKRFGNFQALDDVSLDLPSGEITGLLGPSGSGKTTLLRVIAGLEVADSGLLYFDDQDVTDQPIAQRRVGFVFQDYALFRHMTVAQNVAFGLHSAPRWERLGKVEIRARVAELLAMVQLSSMAGRFPSQLSGGQQQRVALARALAPQPRLLLLDEPFGALDTQVRKDLRRWLLALHRELGFTAIFVTHDQEEALELSDQVAVMHGGRIEQLAEPAELVARPASRFIYDFLGHGNRLVGQAVGGRLVQGDAWVRLPTDISGEGDLSFRPQELRLLAEPTTLAHLPLAVETVKRLATVVRFELRPVGWHSEGRWEVSLRPEDAEGLGLQPGSTCYAEPRSGTAFVGGSDVPEPMRWY